jgi:hypothetical protein
VLYQTENTPAALSCFISDKAVMFVFQIVHNSGPIAHEGWYKKNPKDVLFSLIAAISLRIPIQKITQLILTMKVFFSISQSRKLWYVRPYFFTQIKFD